MTEPHPAPPEAGRWTSLWVVALLSLVAQLWMCQFFSFGELVPTTLDVDPSNLWKYAYHFPPRGDFLVLNWLGMPYLPVPLNPFGLGADLPPWLFFTAYVPMMGTLALLAMAAFLRELEVPRPAALFGALVYAWQGDLLPFIFPGHFPYIATWPFFALAAWGALRAQRTHFWAYALLSGASCGLMVGLQPDRGAIASLLIAAIYLLPAMRSTTALHLRHLVICAGVALLVSLAAFLALFQSNIIGVKLGGEQDRAKMFEFVTQFSLSPMESWGYLIPGFFGWHSSSIEGPYWGSIGQSFDWELTHRSTRNLNLAISTTGTVATVMALLGAALLLPGRWLGVDALSPQQRLFGRLILGFGLVGLVLSWGWHTPLYRPLFALPLMDKWRNPLKWLEYTNFAIVVLSAYGMQHLIASLAEDAKDQRRRLAWATIGSAIGLGLIFLASYPFTVFLRGYLLREEYEYSPVINIINTLHYASFLAAMLMVLACCLLQLLWRPDWLRRWSLPNPYLDRVWRQMLAPAHLALTLALSLGLLVVFQMGWVAGQFIYPARLSVLTGTNPLLEALRAEGDTVRVSVDPSDPILNVLLQNQFTEYGISCLEISAASRIPDDLNAFQNALKNNRARLWFLAGVKNVAVPQQYVAQLHQDPAIAANIVDAAGYTLGESTSDTMPTHALIQLRDFLAKATFVPQAEVIPQQKDLLKRLNDPKWNPRQTVLLPAQAPAALPAATPSQDAPAEPKVDLRTYTPREIVIDVRSPKAGFLLINDRFDPDWEADINGQPALMVPGDFMLRAIPVPAGYSTVTLRYRAHYHVGGLDLPVTSVNLFSDGVMIVAWLIAGIAIYRRRMG